MSPRIKHSILPAIQIIAGSFFFLSLLFRTSLAPDSYLHIGIGRYIIENKRIPTHKDISYRHTEPALEWVTHSWLADTISYLAASIDARYGPILILVGLATLSLSMLWIMATEIDLPTTVKLAIYSLATVLATTFWVIHPLIFAIPLLLITQYIFLLWRKGESNAAFLLPMIMLLWANLAGGYILIMGIYLLTQTLWDTIISIRIGQGFGMPQILPKGNTTILLASVVTALLASLINPYGSRIYIYGVTGYAILGSAKWYSTLAGMLEASNSSVFKTQMSPIVYIIFLLYAIGTITLCGYHSVRNRSTFLRTIWGILPSILLFWLGFYFIRFIPLAAFGTITLSARAWMFFSQTTIRKSYVRRARTIWWLLPLVLFFGVYLITRQDPLMKPPTEQCQLIREKQLVPNILVSTDIVGYMWYCMYPQKQQIDARDDFFDRNDTIGMYGEISTISEENIKELLDDNAINTILVGKENDYLTTFFNTQSSWILVYLDYNGMLFAKKSSLSAEQIRSLALSYVDLSRNLGFDPEQLDKAVEEMERFHTKYPKNELATGQLASLYRFHKDLEKAEATLNQIPQREWGFAMYTEMGRLKAAQGDCSSSEKYFLYALKDRNEQNVSKTVLDMVVLYAACFQDTAKAKHYLLRYTSYPLPESERERALGIAKLFHIELDQP